MTRLDEKKIRIWMLHRDLGSVEALADKSGVAERTIYKAFNGANASLRTVDKLAEALDVHPFDILSANGHPSPHMEAPTVSA